MSDTKTWFADETAGELLILVILALSHYLPVYLMVGALDTQTGLCMLCLGMMECGSFVKSLTISLLTIIVQLSVLLYKVISLDC